MKTIEESFEFFTTFIESISGIIIESILESSLSLLLKTFKIFCGKIIEIEIIIISNKQS